MQAGTHSKSSSAAGPAAGYYYQLRYGLLRALQLYHKAPTSLIAIETLDDVTIEGAGLSIDSQLKHSVDPDHSISKNSPAIWRTLAIWLDRLRQGVDDHHEFHFITTGNVKPQNPIGYLRPDPTNIDVDAAIEGLIEAAKTSTNAKTNADRTVFLKASEGEKLSLVRRIRLIDLSPNLQSISSDIEAALGFACEPDQLADFRNDLEGWWINRVFGAWIDKNGAQVDLEEVSQQVTFLRERYKRNALPLDVPEQDCGDVPENSLFVKQIRAVTDSERRLRNAQRAFLRAGIQRSKWIREHKIAPEELETFDKTLVERWEAEHAGECDKLSQDASDPDKEFVGKSVLHWAERDEVPIRSAKSVYMTSGSSRRPRNGSGSPTTR